MGLVDYSESDSGSDAESVPKPTPKPSATSSKKPFQKVVDRSKPGKIVVNLPQTASPASVHTGADEQPPAKRARTGGPGRFSGFSSFLPPPKNPKATSSGAQETSNPKPRPGVNLKTSSAPGFDRDDDENTQPTGSGRDGGDNPMGLPPPQKPSQAAPSIPDGQIAAENVKITGKPLMFKPLSVARKPAKKKAVKAESPIPPSPHSAAVSTTPTNTVEPSAPPKKRSLFSMHVDDPSESKPAAATKDAYIPLFAQEPTEQTYEHDENGVTSDYNAYVPPQNVSGGQSAPASEALDSVINGMNLSAAARRELFGREGAPRAGLAASRVVNFNMDSEYQHNEELRAAGEQQIHNPVRALQGGKHSLQQLVRNVHDQRDALEDSFAKGRTNRKEASSKYGW